MNQGHNDLDNKEDVFAVASKDISLEIAQIEHQLRQGQLRCFIRKAEPTSLQDSAGSQQCT